MSAPSTPQSTPAGPPDDLDARFEEALRACTVIGWDRRRTAAEELGRLARGAEELGIVDLDGYADGGAVTRLEEELAALLGTEAVVMFPSGTMAQQVALRVWCDRMGSTRVAMPDLSHLLVHESDAVRVLSGLRVEHLTTGPRTPTADDLRGLAADRDGALGAVLVELPLREAGCLLPTWDELVALGECARELGVPLHADGARLLESLPHFDRSAAEVVACVDSVYVSLYKLLGAMGGAVLAGPGDLADDWRTWRHRMGGRLRRLTPYAVGGLLGLREEAPRVPAYVAWARAVAAELVAGHGLRVQPDPPQATSFHVFGAGEERTSRAAALEVMTSSGQLPCWAWRPTEVPGWLRTEVTAHRYSLEVDPVEAAALIARTLA